MLELDRELKHTKIKLHEAQDQCQTAVEIIGNLQKENEDLQSQIEKMTAETISLTSMNSSLQAALEEYEKKTQPKSSGFDFIFIFIFIFGGWFVVCNC